MIDWDGCASYWDSGRSKNSVEKPGTEQPKLGRRNTVRPAPLCADQSTGIHFQRGRHRTNQITRSELLSIFVLQTAQTAPIEAPPHSFDRVEPVEKPGKEFLFLFFFLGFNLAEFRPHFCVLTVHAVVLLFVVRFVSYRPCGFVFLSLLNGECVSGG